MYLCAKKETKSFSTYSFKKKAGKFLVVVMQIMVGQAAKSSFTALPDMTGWKPVLLKSLSSLRLCGKKFDISMAKMGLVEREFASGGVLKGWI